MIAHGHVTVGEKKVCAISAWFKIITKNYDQYLNLDIIID